MTLMIRLLNVRQAVLGALFLATLILLAGCGGGVDEGDLTVPRIQMDTSKIYSPVFENFLDNITVYAEPGATVTVEPSSTTAVVSNLAKGGTLTDNSGVTWRIWTFDLSGLAPGSNQIFITAEDYSGNTNSLLFVPQYARLTIENYNSAPQADIQTIRGLIAPQMEITKITLDGNEQTLPAETGPFDSVSTWSFNLNLAGDDSASFVVYVTDSSGEEYKTTTLTITPDATKPELSIDNSDLIQTTNSVTLTGTVTAPSSVDSSLNDEDWLNDTDKFKITFTNLSDDENELPTVGAITYDSTSQTWSVLLSNLKPGLTRILVDYTDPDGNTAAARSAVLVQE